MKVFSSALFTTSTVPRGKSFFAASTLSYPPSQQREENERRRSNPTAAARTGVARERMAFRRPAAFRRNPRFPDDVQNAIGTFLLQPRKNALMRF